MKKREARDARSVVISTALYLFSGTGRQTPPCIGKSEQDGRAQFNWYIMHKLFWFSGLFCYIVLIYLHFHGLSAQKYMLSIGKNGLSAIPENGLVQRFEMATEQAKTAERIRSAV